MNQGVRIAAACGVLLGGISLAMLFRHESPRTAPVVPPTGEQFLLRKHVGARLGVQGASKPGSRRPQLPATSKTASSPPERSATVLRPTDSGGPPPALQTDFPAPAGPLKSRWGTSIGVGLPGAAPLPAPPTPAQKPPTHKIVDGDTLRALAEKYLDSADRYLEIYQANRDVLSSPEVLPIGVELKLPPHDAAKPPTPNPMPDRPLVPIRDGGP